MVAEVGKKKRNGGRYQTTYTVPCRIASITIWIMARGAITVDEIVTEYRVSPRTARRYLEALATRVFTDPECRLHLTGADRIEGAILGPGER